MKLIREYLKMGSISVKLTHVRDIPDMDLDDWVVVAFSENDEGYADIAVCADQGVKASVMSLLGGNEVTVSLSLREDGHVLIESAESVAKEAPSA